MTSKNAAPELAVTRDNAIFDDLKREILASIEKRLLNNLSDNGKTDFALASMGARVVEFNTSYEWIQPAYHTSMWKSLFGAQFEAVTKPPSLAIQPDISEGNCWAMKGDFGYITIALPRAVVPSGFSIDHSRRSADLKAAPKKVKVYGIRNRKMEHLVDFEYDTSISQVSQSVEVTSTQAYDAFQLKIMSNHGHPHFTCLYRFRVHGAVSE